MRAHRKNSRQRNAILDCVKNHEDHPTADIIYQEVREQFPHISLGTVYRNLSLLTSLGSIRKISCNNHADRFDWHLNPHAHFICNKCGSVSNFPSKIQLLYKEDSGKDFRGVITDQTILFYGLCEDCYDPEGQAATAAMEGEEAGAGAAIL